MRAFPGNDERMSVLHQDSGGIGKSIPSALEISLGHGFCTPRPSGFPSGFALGKSLGSRGAKPTASENLSDFPRPSRFPSGFALGKSLGSREIGRRGWISQYLPRLGGARIHCLTLFIIPFPSFRLLMAFQTTIRMLVVPCTSSSLNA